MDIPISLPRAQWEEARDRLKARADAMDGQQFPAAVSDCYVASALLEKTLKTDSADPLTAVIGLKSAGALESLTGWGPRAQVARLVAEHVKRVSGRTLHTHGNPMPGPLRSAMSSLLRHGARVGPDASWEDGQGHHLIATSGPVTAHVTLALDYFADGVDWADGDLSWAVTRDGAPVPCDRWSQVCDVFRSVAPAEQGG
ncbi:hypothetical protein [Streptomyces griseoaurantiacus]|uniref:hypothetical protein n=1 Tax=Streptomyces griseoaurantiacus TaxID=68213 RepID=UPI0036C81B33